MTIIVMIFAIFSYILLFNRITTDIETRINRNLAIITTSYLGFDEENTLFLVDLQEDQQTLSEFLQRNNQSIRIIDQDKNILAQLGLFKYELKPSTSAINSVFLTGQSQSTIFIDADKNQNFYIIAPIIFKDHVQGVIELSQPINDAMKTLNNLILILVIGVFASIVISLIAGYYLSKQTLGYVDELIDNVDAITDANDLGKRLPVPTDYSDELTRLASIFNSLLSKVEAELVREKNFTSNASHDLRTPLTIIQGNVDLAIKKKNLTPSQTSKLMHNIKNETKRMANMLEDLLELSAIEKNYHANSQKINVFNILSEVTDGFRPQAKNKNISIEFKHKYKSDLFQIQGNPVQIKRVFSNIIDNAIKYNTTNGKIIIKTFTKTNRCYIIIQDTGLGIPAKDLPYIFDRLYQSKKTQTGIQRGFGIGLAIVKDIISIHSGQIKVTSRENEGTKFTIIFPQII